MFGLFKKFEPFILDVPYAQKDKVKALGARWNAKEKTWYAPSEKIKNKCEAWWPKGATSAATPDDIRPDETPPSVETSGRFLLNVPYGEKDEAKSLGARWDVPSKSWYAADEDIKNKCKKWWPSSDQAPDKAIKGPYEILVSENSCYKCGTISKVAAIGVSSLKEGEDEVGEIWYNTSLILMHIEYLHEAFIGMIKQFNRGFSKRFSRQYGGDVWMNCCDNCDAHFGDFFMMVEPGRRFPPNYGTSGQIHTTRRIIWRRPT